MRYCSLLFAVICILCFPSYAVAQGNIGHRWEDGPLRWERDFRASPPADATTGAMVKIGFGYQRVKAREGYRRTIYRGTYNKALPQYSWVLNDYKNPAWLAYQQLVFDIYEIYRRRLLQAVTRQEYDKNSNLQRGQRYRSLSGESLNRLRESHLTDASREVGLMKSQTDKGTDVAALEAWREQVNDRLAQLGPEPMPDFISNPVAIVLGLGLGTSLFTGDLGRAIVQPTGPAMHFGVQARRWHFGLDMHISSTSFTELNFIGQPVTVGVGYSYMNVLAGYTLLERGRHQLTPVAGLLFMSLLEQNAWAWDNPFNPTELSPAVGFTYDFTLQIRTHLLTGILSNPGSQDIHCLRTKLLVAPATLGSASGGVVNLSLFYLFRFGSISY